MHPSNTLSTTHKNGNRLTLNGFEVWISCANNAALTQYNEDYDATKGEATCWIPSEAGQVSPAPITILSLAATYPDANNVGFLDLDSQEGVG